jgi:hypothetical protein
MPKDLEQLVMDVYGKQLGDKIVATYPLYFCGYNISRKQFLSNCDFVKKEIM